MCDNSKEDNESHNRLCCHSDDNQGQHQRTEQLRTPDPLSQSSLISKLLFIWPHKLLKLGMKRPLTDEDLPEVSTHDSSSYQKTYLLNKIWENECKKHPNNPSLHRAILRDYLFSIWYVQPLMMSATVAKVVQALALGLLVESFDTNGDDGYLWASVLVICGLVVLFEHHHTFFFTWRKGMRYRTGCVAAIYDKSLRLSSISQNTTNTAGKIINLATNDVERFLMAALFVSFLFWAPLQSLAILGIGIYVLGPAFVAGFSLLVVVFIPLQFYLSKRFATLRSKIASITDQRVTLVSQAIYGVRVMKMSGWEKQFQNRIAEIRQREVHQLRKANKLKAYNECLFFSSSIIISIVVFVVHVLTGGTLNSRVVFATISLLNIVQLEMTKHVSLGVMGVSEVFVSISRIQRFLQHPELQASDEGKNCITNNDAGSKARFSSANNEAGRESKKEKGAREPALSMSNVTCYWNETKLIGAGSFSSKTEDEDDESTSSASCAAAISNVTLEFYQKELICVIGAVGSGKSALLQAIVGELPIWSGALNRRYCAKSSRKQLAYAAQDPWIMDGTVKENILMGLEFKNIWYNEVVNACGLSDDIQNQFRDGDETIVGDRGVQCSGGQRARIGLARALYRDTDIIVCDDPLSAVDAKVGRHIFNEAIVRLCVNRGKCIILATHQHQYVNDYRCVLMIGGKVQHVGSYKDCVNASGGQLTAHHEAEDKSIHKMSIAGSDAGTSDINDRNNDDEKLSATFAGNTPEEKSKGDAENDDGKEMNVTGLVSLDTYVNYAKAMGGVWIAISLLIFFGVTQASVLFTIYVIGEWAERPVGEQTSWDIIGLVIGLGCLVVLLALIRALVSFRFLIKASQRLHDRMTSAVLRAKIEFYDSNPLGRILNRFAGDTGSNDDLLPHTMFDFLMIAFFVIGAIITTITVLPFVLLAIPPLLWYFIYVRKIFVTTTRELKRLEGLARSPIFAMLSESLSGIATIRSNDALQYFQQKFERAHDAHTRAFFSFISSSRWLGFRMDAIMFLFLTAASYLAVLFKQQNWFNIEPAALGLSLTMLLQLAGIFQWCIRQSAEVVNQMVSVERVLQFGQLPSEAALFETTDTPLIEKNWPKEGSIEVHNLSARYRSTLPLSLQGISFKIDKGFRVGVVGRTGSGKSTLVQCLFRLLEAEEGYTQVDGVDIATVGLHTLRTNISVIPQMPVLFTATVRENLDPFSKYTDQEINAALQDVCMYQHVTDDLPNGLNSMVSEGGSNFSVGQRQLLCLARAILCKNKILVLDEPTANVDRRTDQLLQQALQKSFVGATILSVAHRLDTVIDYDRILVLGGGRVLEYGPPAELLSKSDGYFNSMVDDTGLTMSKELRRRAGVPTND